MRVGLGVDQRVASDDGLDGLVGVVFGAVVEALCGAAGLSTALLNDGDETASPAEEESGPEVQDAEVVSETALRRAVRLVERHNYQVVNVDVTVWADRSSLEERLPPMRERLAQVLHVASANVVTKPARGGGVPGLEAGDGFAAIAVMLLSQIADLDALHASIRSGG